MPVVDVALDWMCPRRLHPHSIMVRKFKRSDEGMTVRTADRDDVGTIETVKGNTAHMTPQESISDSIRQRLGWEAEGEAVYELDHSKVKAFDNDEVRLKD